MAVFKIFRPTPDADGIIRGNVGTTVHFNNCQSRPADPDDELKFSYDWTNDGTVDYFGTCRQHRQYSSPRPVLAEDAKVCVSDRRGNEICKIWFIRLGTASTH